MEDVLRRKFNFTAERSAEARQRVRALARTVTPAVVLDVVREDPADNRILESAVAAGSDFVVTGDKDLLRLGRYDSIRILRPADLLGLAEAQATEIRRRRWL
jgi:predicted nucleic acid-binding protein